MICFVGIFACLASTISRAAAKNDGAVILVMAGITLSVILLLVVINRFKVYTIGVWLTVITVCDLFFPMAFFLLGGMSGGMPIYFVLSTVLIFLLFKGWSLCLHLLFHISIVAGCFALSIRYPSLLVPLKQSMVVFEHLQSLFITGFFLGMVLKFQEAIYFLEKKKADKSLQQMKEADERLRVILEEIEKQDALLNTLNDVAAILLKSVPADFESDLWRCMGMIARVVDVDKVCIWKNRINNGELRAAPLYEWSETAALRKDREAGPDLSCTDIPGWDELSRGRCYGGAAADLPENQRKMYGSRGIVSFFMVPAFVRGLFWGFAGFDSCRDKRDFSADEEGILRSAGLLIANAMQRNEMTENLISAREDALSSTRAKSNFLANMSHEIRTPMNAIIGMTNIALGAADTEKKDYCLSKIVDASTHLLRIINDILDMSKIEAGKFELSYSEFNFEKVLRGAANVIGFQAEGKKQRFTVTLGPGIPPLLYGDEQRLVQVVTNLLSNAVKFTPEGGAIDLETSFLGEEGGLCTLRIAVRDNGIGISEEQRKRLFTSFEQADSDTSRKYGGTGLGLAISKRIVEMMGGEIRLESEPGRGSVFTFTVKLKRGQIPLNGVEDAGSGEGPAVLKFPGRRILLAEDIEINREIVLSLLEDTELEIDCAENGVEAVEKFSADPDKYDMIFMDVQMPEMDGYEAARRIRAEEKQIPPQAPPLPRRVPIIAMTANVFKEDVEKCLESGMDGHVGKPLDIDDVMDKLQRYLPSREKGA
jgi:signal transduction histidine kinase/CheY-like chemotaxis protein